MSSAHRDDTSFGPYYSVDDIFEFGSGNFDPGVLRIQFVDDDTLIMHRPNTDEVIVAG